MKQLIVNSLRALLIVPVLALGVSALAMPTQTVFAEGPNETNCGTGSDSLSIGNGADCAFGEGQSTDITGQQGIFVKITNVLLFIIGAIAVIMLVIGGIRYTISGGDSTAVTAAKNTILYAIVGIVVALLAYAVVNFVVGSFSA